MRNSLEFRFVCPLANGLHARPASAVAEVAGRFDAECALRNLRNGADAAARSVLSLLAAEIRAGDECVVRVTGPDAEAACAALRGFFATELQHCDEPLAVAMPAAARDLPRALAGAACLRAAAVSPGIAEAALVFAQHPEPPQELLSQPPGDPAGERRRFQDALDAVRDRLERQCAASRATERAILRAHLALLGDPSLAESVAAMIARGRSAPQAVFEACESFIARLRNSETAYLRERALDLQDIRRQLVQQIAGTSLVAAAGIPELPGPSIVVAEALTPQQLLALDRAHLRGIVLGSAGATSHTAILARTLAIPAVGGVDAAGLRPGQTVLLDGARGALFTDVTPAVRRFYDRERAALRRREAALARVAQASAVTADGRPLEVGVNLSAAGELRPAFALGADGVGVFRTELLFAAGPGLPSEDEQFAVYAEAARAAAGKPVVIRTLDIGGDKPLPALELPREPNPFLGCRGVRLYPRHQPMIRAQVRAALRASALGDVRLMLPMVSRLEELRWFRALVEDVKRELAAAAVAFNPGIQVGIMVEVPSAAFQLDQLAAESAFFSIGTNDLAQYFFAADRDNPRVAPLANVREPAFLRFLKQLVDAARRNRKWIGLCGDMAADPLHLPLMLGLGLDEISVPAPQVPLLKQRVARLLAARCDDLLARALACASADDVDLLLAGAAALETPRPLLDPELVALDSGSASKDEAMRELADLLDCAGRTGDRDALEAALWAREQASSTAAGNGLAIPHCKSDAVRAASIAVLRLARPVDWESPGQQPVQLVVLLALRASDAGQRHLQAFARLARKLVDPDVRQRLLRAVDADAVVAELRPALEIDA